MCVSCFVIFIDFFLNMFFFFFSSRRRHTRCGRDWSSDVCSSDLLAGHDRVGSRSEELGGVIGWFGAAYDYFPPSGARAGNDGQYVRARHQIAVDAEGGRWTRIKNAEQFFARSERGIVNLDVVPLRSEMRREIENAERRVRLHDAELFRIFHQEVSVCEEQLHHATPAATVVAQFSS